MTNSLLLKSKIITAGHTQGSLAEAIGISGNTMTAKVNNRIPFNTCEVIKICDTLQITDPVEKCSIFLV